MLTALRFVQGAVAKKDLKPVLTHFNLRDGRIVGYNGAMALSSPIGCDLNCSPRAKPFTLAILTCKGTVAMHLRNGRLVVASDRFQASIPCTTDPFPDIVPEGDRVPLPSGLVDVLKALAPFIAEDASRRWARGILFQGNTALATNNIILVEKWIPEALFPVPVNIPESAVLELIRIGEDPIAIQVSDRHATFHFKGERWMRTQLFSTKWPDVSSIWVDGQQLFKLTEDFYEAVSSIAPFADVMGAIYLTKGAISTHVSREDGAHLLLPDLEGEAIFHHKYLSMLRGIATHIDLSTFSSLGRVPFYGKGLRGLIVGMKL